MAKLGWLLGAGVLVLPGVFAHAESGPESAEDAEAGAQAALSRASTALSERFDCVEADKWAREAQRLGAGDAAQAILDEIYAPLGGLNSLALPRQVKLDLLGAETVEALRTGNYPVFLANLCAMEATGLVNDLPGEARIELDYHRAVGLRQAGRPVPALEALNRYLAAATSSNESYQQALLLLRPLTAEAQKDTAEKNAERDRAEAERARRGAELARTAAHKERLAGVNASPPGAVFRDAFVEGAGQGPEMVVLPAGSFTMGSPASEKGRYADQGPQRTVRIGYRFAVGRYEVTFAEWDACVADGGCNNHTPSDGNQGRGQRPVVHVSWDDAQAFVTWLNRKTDLGGSVDRYRLLTEAEWEYAARAGSQTRWSFGDDERRLGEVAWFDKNARGVPRNVGELSPNAFGLYDMHGNVKEWVEDYYFHTYSSLHPSDGSAFDAVTVPNYFGRVVRGGSAQDPARWLSSAGRASHHQTLDRGPGIGFRVARTLSE